MRNKTYSKYKFPIVFWTIFTLSMYLFTFQSQGHTIALKLLFVFFLPITIPVHLHEFVFNKYFLKKHFLLYSIFTVLILTVFSFIFNYIESLVTPNSNNSMVASIIIIIFIYMGVKYLIIGTKQQLKMNQLKAQQTEAELNLLKSQLNPHFLFNALNSIYSLSLKNSQKTSEAVLLLSDLMRYILESSMLKKVPLNEEIDFIDNYIKLEELRSSSNFNLNYTKIGDFSNLHIAPMILITFVENIFKHGIGMNQTDNIFDIRIEVDNKTLIFTCCNNIILKKSETEKKNVKNGIDNVKKRLNLIYPDKHVLEIETNTKYIIKLKINLSSDAKV